MQENISLRLFACDGLKTFLVSGNLAEAREVAALLRGLHSLSQQCSEVELKVQVIKLFHEVVAGLSRAQIAAAAPLVLQFLAAELDVEEELEDPSYFTWKRCIYFDLVAAVQQVAPFRMFLSFYLKMIDLNLRYSFSGSLQIIERALRLQFSCLTSLFSEIEKNALSGEELAQLREPLRRLFLLNCEIFARESSFFKQVLLNLFLMLDLGVEEAELAQFETAIVRGCEFHLADLLPNHFSFLFDFLEYACLTSQLFWLAAEKVALALALWQGPPLHNIAHLGLCRLLGRLALCD